MVADTYSALLGLLEQGTGNNNNTWGALLNTGVMDKVDLAVAGLATYGTTTGTLDLSASPPPAGPSGAIQAILAFNGALVGNVTVQVPNLSKIWLVNNATSGAFTLKFKTPAGAASAAIQQGGWTLVWCDGANVINVGISPGGQAIAILHADGTVSAPGISFLAETNSGIYRKSSQVIGVAINGVEILEIAATGVNVVAGTLNVGGASVFLNWVAGGGTADAITATYSPAVPALTDGLLCAVRLGATANVTTTPTFAPNGLTAHVVTKLGGVALKPGDLAGTLAEYWFRYNLANTRWEVVNPAFPFLIGTGLTQNGSTLNVQALPCAAAFKNLSIKVASNTTVNVVADFVTVTDGTNYQSVPLNCTVNLGTAGVINALDTGTIAIDTFYAIWAYVKADGTAGAIASTSATAPGAIAGYTFKARVGWVQTIHATATLYGTWQLGRRAQYVVGLAQTTAMPIMASANVGVAGYTAIPLARFVPTTAAEIVVTASMPNTNSSIAVAPNNSYGNIASLTNPPPLALNQGSGSFATTANLLIESANIYYQSSSTGNGVFCLGWVDNI